MLISLILINFFESTQMYSTPLPQPISMTYKTYPLYTVYWPAIPNASFILDRAMMQVTMSLSDGLCQFNAVG